MPNGRSGGFAIKRIDLEELLRSLPDSIAVGNRCLNDSRAVSAAEVRRVIQTDPRDQVPVEEQDHVYYIVHLGTDFEDWFDVKPGTPLYTQFRRYHADWLLKMATQEKGARRARAMDSKQLLIAVGCFVAAAFVYSLTRGPWDPSQLKTVTGVVSDYSEVQDGHRSCFVIRMATIKESFELCSSSYDNFDKATFQREVQKGTFLELKVVAEIKRNSATGETKYWVEDIRTPDGRVYLELEDIQKSLKRERIIGLILVVGLVVAALVNLRKAMTK